MSHTNCSAALATRLSGITPAYPVVWENTAYDPPDGEVYLAEGLNPTATQPVGPDPASSDVLEGFYTVLCYAPAGGGKGAAFQAADDVVLRFPRGLQLTHDGVVVTILRSEMGPGFTSGARYVVPVTVYYRAAI